MPALPEYEIYAIRHAKQDQRDEGHMFLGGQHGKMIQGLDFFTYALKGGGRTRIVNTGMMQKQASLPHVHGRRSRNLHQAAPSSCIKRGTLSNAPHNRADIGPQIETGQTL